MLSCLDTLLPIRQGDAILVEASVSGKPFKLHQLATTQAEASWELPTHGVLLCKLLWLQEAHLHHLAPEPTPMSEISSDTILDVLIGDLRPVDQDVFLKTGNSQLTPACAS